MSARTIRRAAERRAKKLAAKAATSSASSPAVTPDVAQTLLSAAPRLVSALSPSPQVDPGPSDSSEAQPISEARLAANRENAQKSTGPRTDEGKAKVRFNSVKHGLTGATILFTNPADAQRYNQHSFDYQHLYQPVGPEENSLVQSIIDTRWRLATAPLLEFAVIARGSAAIIETNPTLWNNPDRQTDLLLEVRRQNEKELRNLQLQEHRLARRCERDTAQLQRLQTERKANEEYKLAEAAKAVLLAEHRDPNAEAAPVPGLGFAFSADRLDAYLRRLTHVQEQSLLQQALAEAVETPKTQTAAA
jgi:hypothetical protein